MQRATLEVGLGFGIEVSGLAGARAHLRVSNATRIWEELIIFLMKFSYQASNEKSNSNDSVTSSSCLVLLPMKTYSVCTSGLLLFYI